MANLLLGVTGSVAALRTPALYEVFTRTGHAVKIVATDAATYFFDPAGLPVIRDTDEWPRDRYARGDAVLHIELRNWADLLLVAPLDANTLAKFAGGLCDNCLTCVWRAWDAAKPVAVAPAMNTHMWNHPATARHLKLIAEDCPTLTVIGPIEKGLACGDLGMGGMAEVPQIVEAVEAILRGGRKAE